MRKSITLTVKNCYKCHQHIFDARDKNLLNPTLYSYLLIYLLVLKK